LEIPDLTKHSETPWLPGLLSLADKKRTMDKKHASVQPVDLEDIIRKGGSLYQAIAITARRARQINDEIKQEYQQRISTLVPIDMDEDDEMEATNFDQMRISLEIDKMGKPTLEAMEEFKSQKLEFRYRDRENS
jgi:DNA-directed RNA polymerase subunit K/omega